MPTPTYSIDEIASFFRGKIQDDNPLKDDFASMSNEQFVSSLIDTNPELHRLVDFNSLGQGLKAFGVQTKPVIGSLAQLMAEVNEGLADQYGPDMEAIKDRLGGTSAAEMLEESRLPLGEGKSVNDLLFNWGEARRKAGNEAAAKAFQEDPYLKAYSLWFADKAEDATIDTYFEPKMMGALVGQALPTMVGGLALYAGGNAVVPGIGGGLAFSGMFGLEGGMQYNEVYEDLIARKYSEEEARKLATYSGFQTGTINAILENLRLGSFFKRFGLQNMARRNLSRTLLNKTADKFGGLKNLAKKVPGAGATVNTYRRFINSAAGGVVTQALQEGVEEWAQGMNQRMSELGFNDYTIGEVMGAGTGAEGTPSSPGLIEFFGGLYGGGIVSTPFSAYSSIKTRRGQKATKEANAIAKMEREQFDEATDKSYEAGEEAAQTVDDNVTGGSRYMDWGDYVKGIWAGGGYTFPEWKTKKTPEDASDAALQSLEDQKNKRTGPQRTLAAMKKSGKGRALLDEIGEYKADAEAQLRVMFMDMFPLLISKGRSDPAFIDELIDDYLEGGTKIQKMVQEETKEARGSIIEQAEAHWLSSSGPQYSLNITDSDLRDRVVEAALAGVNVKQSDISSDFEAGIIDMDEMQARQVIAGYELDAVKSMIKSAEEGVSTEATSQAEQFLENQAGNLTKTDIESIVEQSLIEAAEQAESDKQSASKNKDLIKARNDRIKKGKSTVDDIASLRGEIVGFVKDSPEELASVLGKKTATELKAVIKSFGHVTDFDPLTDDRYPSTKGGDLSFSSKNKKIVANALAEDILGFLGKDVEQEVAPPTSPVSSTDHADILTTNRGDYRAIIGGKEYLLTGSEQKEAEYLSKKMQGKSANQHSANKLLNILRGKGEDNYDFYPSDASPSTKVSWMELQKKIYKRITEDIDSVINEDVEDPQDKPLKLGSEDIKPSYEGSANKLVKLLNKLKMEGKEIIGSGSSTATDSGLKDKFGNWSGIAYVAAASTTPSSFYKNLSKLGFSDEQIDLVRKTIKDKLGSTEDFQRDARTAAKSLEKKPTVSAIYQELSDNLVKSIGAAIQNIQQSTEDNLFAVRIADTDDAWALLSPQFNDAWDSFYGAQSQRTDDQVFAFQMFVRGTLNGIRSSDAFISKRMARWFIAWAKNHELGQANTLNLFHDISIPKKLAGVFSPTRRAMQTESAKYGTNIIKEYEQTDQEGLDQLEDDLTEDITGYRDLAEESLHVVSTNIKRLIETSTGVDVTAENMEDVQEAAFEAAEVEDFWEFLENTYDVPIDDLEIDAANRIVNYWNTMQNRMPRGEKMYFTLSNVNYDNEMDTDRDFSYYLRLKKQDWKTRTRLSGYVSKNFLDEKDLGERTAFLYASDILQVFKLKRAHGEVFDEDGLALEDKIFAKENRNNLDEGTIYRVNVSLGSNFESFGSDAPMFIVGMKGGNSRALVTGKATEFDIENGLDAELQKSYIQGEIDKGYMTEEQAQNLKDYAEKELESNPYVWIQLIGRHEYWKAAFHNRVLSPEFVDPISGKTIKNNNNIQWMYNRMRLILGEGNVAVGMGNSTMVLVDPEETDMFYQGKKLDHWSDYLNEAMKRYGFDGTIFTSHPNLIKKEDLLGVSPVSNRHSGWLKTIISAWEDDGDSFLGIKGLEMLVPEGMEWRTKDGEVIAKSIRDQDDRIIIVDYDGKYIDQITSTEEAKIGVGRYSNYNTPFTIPENATRILQTPGEYSKNSSATPTQWLDLMLDPELLMKNSSASRAYSIMRKHLLDVEDIYLEQLDQMAQYPGLTGDYLKRLRNKKTLAESEMDQWLNILEGDELGILAHNYFVDMYEPMLKNRLIVDGAFKGRKTNFSSYLHLRPNFAGDLNEWEGAVSVRDRVTWGKFQKQYLSTLTSGGQRRDFKILDIEDKVEVINDWLDTNPLQEWEYWFLGFRIPVNGMTAVQMYKMTKFTADETGDTAEFHPVAVLGDMQGDWDGDTVNLKWMNKEDTEALMEFTRKQNEDGSWGLSDIYQEMHNPQKLEMFKMPPGNDLSDPDAVIQGVYKAYTNTGAMGLLMNAISLRGVLQAKDFSAVMQERTGARKGETFNINMIKASDTIILPFELRDDIVQENLNPGEKLIIGEDGGKYLQTSSRNALSILLQAALDDAKYGLLNHWGYGDEGTGGIPFAFKQIFNKVYEDGTEADLSVADIWKIWRMINGSNFYFGFRYSQLRNGIVGRKNKIKGSMRQIMFSSKRVFDQSELNNEELASKIKMNANSGFVRFDTPRVIDVNITNNPTHFEELLKRPYEFFVERYGDEAYLSFLRNDVNTQKNAHKATMDAISEQIDTYRLPEAEGGIFTDGISPEDEVAGYNFFRKVAKDFYKIHDEGKTLNRSVIRDTSFSIAAYDYDEAFKQFKIDYQEKFDALSPQAKFVSTVWFLQGQAGDYTSIAPEVARDIADLSNQANFITGIIKDYKNEIANLGAKYKREEKLIEKGELSDVEAKPTKTGKMFLEYLGNQRPDVKSLNTFDAIIAGERTATTRFKKIEYWDDLAIGDTILFSDNTGRSMLVRVTDPAKHIDFGKMTESELDEWSKLEGWSIERAEEHAKKREKGVQFQFELVDRTPPPGDVLYPNMRIISGMQTGADVGAVKAGKYDLGLNVGGAMPSGYKTSDGFRPDYEAEFNAHENKSADYPSRTMENVEKSDGTLAFRLKPSAGTDKTIGYARTGEWQKTLNMSGDQGFRPILILKDAENSEINRDMIRNFIERNNIKVLNVAGHTEQKSKGIENNVRVLINAALREEPQSIKPLTGRLDNIKREALRKKKLIQNREVELQEIIDKLDEFQDTKKASTVRAKKRYINQLLPVSLSSPELVKIFAKEFGAQLPLATDDTPTEPFLISYKEFDIQLNKKLEENGDCD